MKANHVSADSAFKSMSKREVINIKDASEKPSPCTQLFFCISFKVLILNDLF